MTGRLRRRLVLGSALAVVVTAVLPGSGLGSSAAAARGARAIPAGLVTAIHARLGAGAIRSSLAAPSEPGPLLGYSVALSADGTTALVGAPGAHRLKGGAYIFHVSDQGSWTSTETPTASLANVPGPADFQFFGFSVALSADGTTAVVGAPLARQGQSSEFGEIYVFHVSAEDAWASTSTPTATLRVADTLFLGISLALTPDGTTLVAGAPYQEPGGAYVFHVSSEDAWVSTSTPTAALSNSHLGSGDGAGYAVAISDDGTTALVDDSEDSSGGGAYVFHASAEDAWTTTATPTAILTDSNITGFSELGSSLALSADGTLAFLASPVANSGHGVVDVFHASGEAAWASTSTPTATLTAADGWFPGRFGLRVAVSADGTSAFVGANGGRGKVDVFRVADEGAWTSSSAPTATLTNTGGHAGDALGVGLALSGDGATLLAGVPEVHFETGAVDVFHVSDASSWASSSAPTAILTNSRLNQCLVPRLHGLKIARAKSLLRARSCRLGTVRRVVHRPAWKGRVVFQSPEPGSRRHVGTKVNVKVAK